MAERSARRRRRNWTATWKTAPRLLSLRYQLPRQLYRPRQSQARLQLLSARQPNGAIGKTATRHAAAELSRVPGVDGVEGLRRDPLRMPARHAHADDRNL